MLKRSDIHIRDPFILPDDGKYYMYASNGHGFMVYVSEDLETFLEGFVQGAMCTMHIDLYKGHNGHHIWEAIYRAVGSALNKTLTVEQSRKGKTSGVGG